MSGQQFIKMHGLGNDFVVLDARTRPIMIDGGAARRIADRQTGVGCDQIIIIEPSTQADVRFRFLNSDGGEAEACGNGTRCVISRLLAESSAEVLKVETRAGILAAWAADSGWYSVAMGVPQWGWREIPLAREMDTLHLDLAIGPASRPVLSDPVALSIGNPHAVFFVDDVDAVDVMTVGPMLEHDPLFPARANIGFAQVGGPDQLRLRVWERGAGLTRACGSGACAAAVAAVRRGYTGRRVSMLLDGGELEVEWRESDGQVVMSGPVATSFSGTLPASMFESAPGAAAGAAA